MPEPTPPRALTVYAWAVLAFMVLVILWGAIVRTTGSGAGCGVHWPLCNGDFVPHHPRLATIIEFTHRSMSGILTTLIAILAVWVFCKRPKGDLSRTGAIAVVLFLITEALLGAALVLGGWVDRNASNTRVVMQAIHVTNTLLLLGALALTAWWIGHPQRKATTPSPNRHLATATIVMTLLATATGAVAALADTLFPSPTLTAALAQDFAADAPLIVRTRWMHPAETLLVLLCVLLLCRRVRGALANIVLGLLALQFLLGIADVLLLAPQGMQILHLLGADLFWIALVILVNEARRVPHTAEKLTLAVAPPGPSPI